MRPHGFSTGALAKGDFARGVAMQRDITSITAIELSALRDGELAPLVDALGDLDLSRFDSISFHAPSRLKKISEAEAVALLSRVPPAWPIVVHPDVVRTPSLWRELGERVCIENMDDRKPIGRSVSELKETFAQLPEATFCLDVGHARQIDATLANAEEMLAAFGDRLRQLHVSYVGATGEHLALTAAPRDAFTRIAHRIPQDCPLIVESVVTGDAIERELAVLREMFGA